MSETLEERFVQEATEADARAHERRRVHDKEGWEYWRGFREGLLLAVRVIRATPGAVKGPMINCVQYR